MSMRRFGVIYEKMMPNNNNLDIYWLKDKSLEDLENLPAPDIIAKDITKNLQSTLDSLEILKKIWKLISIKDIRLAWCKYLYYLKDANK